MDDATIREQIEQLVEEEQRLLQEGAGEGPDDARHARLHMKDVSGLKCADLVDAVGRLHRHRCHILDLVSPTSGQGACSVLR